MSGCGGSISPTGSGTEHSCLNCGACCAAFRVSFYWAEAEGRGLPVSLTEKLNPWMSCMAGTNAAAPHCVALSGKIGQRVACEVYPQRPSPCREVAPGDDQCRRARRVYGLPPLV
jgi:Fe-S-cluster containining protein